MPRPIPSADRWPDHNKRPMRCAATTRRGTLCRRFAYWYTDAGQGVCFPHRVLAEKEAPHVGP